MKKRGEDYMMFTLQMSREQMDKLLVLLDTALRQNGLSSLQDAVDLFNVVNSAKPLEEHNEKISG